jgi:5-methylcytosine-specific restriction endonuclease McrA
MKYLDGTLDLKDTELLPYQALESAERILTDAYCIYYLKLKSHDAESKEEDIVQTFLRLQEGTPLNKAEKISAHRGTFKDAFKEARDTSELFKLMSGDRRFRFRLLAAEMLLLELEEDFKNKVFPSLELQSLISAIKKYEKRLPRSKLRFYRGNLDLLHSSLNYLLTALKPRDLLAFYLLVSYLRKYRAGNQNLVNEISAFAKKFLRNLNSFGIYDEKAPGDMKDEIFQKYRAYKLEAKVMTTPESIKKRFEMILEEFTRLKPYIEKDPQRYHDEEQKRTLFFRQDGLCGHCGKPIDFRKSSADHVVSHSEGGKTDDLRNAQLLHEKCHQKLEKSRKKKRKRGVVA